MQSDCAIKQEIVLQLLLMPEQFQLHEAERMLVEDFYPSAIRLGITLLAELAYNNLLFQHFQLFIFPSVVCVSQISLGLTLLLKCRVQKLGLDSRSLVLFDWIDRFIVFWRDFQAITGKCFSQSEYVVIGAIFSLREEFHCAFHCALHYVNLSNICNKEAFHSINLSNVRFFIASQWTTDWLKYFCVIMKTSTEK